MKTIFEKSKPANSADFLPKILPPEKNLKEFIPEKFISPQPPPLPELSEAEVVRHYTRLSRKNFSVDTHFYPLGSCTMKYNPRINEQTAQLPGFTQAHPYLPEELVPGCLSLMAELDDYLCEITGMDGFSLQPSAGAHGEITALLMAGAYFRKKREERKIILVPDSSHGTNPASAAMAGFSIKQIKSDAQGNVDMADLERNLDEKVAVMMLTNPNTLGLFETEILKLSEMIHKAGALLYYDGANLNALMGIARPGDMGFDVIHLNLHKTFSTPHGGGGPGAGPVGVKDHLKPFLPNPRIIEREDGLLDLADMPDSIGRMKLYYGNFLVMVRAYTYMRMLGAEGLKRMSQVAVLNANYLRTKISKFLEVPYNRLCMHEFIASDDKLLKETGVSTKDIAKALLDYRVHPPTIYFPLIVREALMIEPTETETKETLDLFVEALEALVEMAHSDPAWLHDAPHFTPVRRLDDVLAARKPDVCFTGDSCE